MSQQREEEERKDEEKKRSLEERRRLEKERVLKERRDTEERDRKMNEKLQMIEEQRFHSLFWPLCQHCRLAAVSRRVENDPSPFVRASASPKVL